MKDPG